jgi:hypothetical protein
MTTNSSNVHRLDTSPLAVSSGATPSDRQALPDYLKPRVAADQPGRGVSEDTDDTLYPLITIFQSTSKGVNARSPDYIPGAAPGKFYRRSSTCPVRDGEQPAQGIEAIVWFCDSVFKEWSPGRARVVGVHLQRPEDACIDPNTGNTVRRSNGNELIKTKQILLLHEGKPFELPLSSTGTDFFRDLTAHFRSYTDEQGRGLPSYVRRYRFFTSSTSNAKGSWFILKFTDLGWVTGDEYDRARQLSEELEKSLKQRRKALFEARRNGTQPSQSSQSSQASPAPGVIGGVGIG